jgi:hypothetical protein
VDSIIASCTGYPLPDLETGHIRTQGFDHTRRGIAQRQRFVQAIESGLDSGQETIPTGFFDHLFYQVRARTGFFQQVLFGKLNHRPFGSSGDQGGTGTDKCHSWTRTGYGDIFDAGSTGAHVLQDLFHRLNPYSE